jgi:catechol-2,3-dioxygenase
VPSSVTNEKRTSVRGLGEIALRVNNLDAMQKFYEEVIGLSLMTRVPSCAFFRIADGYGGHTQVLARDWPSYRPELVELVELLEVDEMRELRELLTEMLAGDEEAWL